jgi:hypothetical protein
MVCLLPCGASGPVAQLGARVNGIHEVTGSIPVWSTISSASESLKTRDGSANLLRLLCRAREPAAQVVGGFVGRRAVEGHQRAGSARLPGNLRPPAVVAHLRHFDDEGPAVDGLLNADDVHGCLVRTRRRSVRASCNARMTTRKRSRARRCTRLRQSYEFPRNSVQNRATPTRRAQDFHVTSTAFPRAAFAARCRRARYADPGEE